MSLITKSTQSSVLGNLSNDAADILKRINQLDADYNSIQARAQAQGIDVGEAKDPATYLSKLAVMAKTAEQDLLSKEAVAKVERRVSNTNQTEPAEPTTRAGRWLLNAARMVG